MAKFEYKGIDASGAVIKKIEEGASIEDVSTKLMEMGVSILDIQPVAAIGGKNMALEKGGPALKKQGTFSALFGGVTTKELKIFYVNLATLVAAGISLRACVNALADQTENPYFQTILVNISQSIEAGKSFSDAVAVHPKIFPVLFVSMLRAGEESGKFDEVLRRYAIYCEKQEKIMGKLKGAMVMPVILVAVATIVVIGLLTYVFPTFMKLFTGKEDKLPAPTKIVMGVSNFLQNNYFQLIGYIVGTIVAMKIILNSNAGWRIFCYLQLNTPLLGNLFRKSYIANFCQNMATMLKAGVSSLRALQIAQNSITNVLMREIVDQIYESVERGSSFAGPMMKNRQFFPSMVTLMINIGEESGTLNQMFEKISEYYEAETDAAIDGFLTAIEPMITIVMGAFVCLIAMSMFLPLFDMNRIMKD